MILITSYNYIWKGLSANKHNQRAPSCMSFPWNFPQLFVCLQEAKPPCSYGFPMIFPFSYGFPMVFPIQGRFRAAECHTVRIHVTSEASNLRRRTNDDRCSEVPQWKDGEFSPWTTPSRAQVFHCFRCFHSSYFLDFVLYIYLYFERCFECYRTIKIYDTRSFCCLITYAFVPSNSLAVTNQKLMRS